MIRKKEEPLNSLRANPSLLYKIAKAIVCCCIVKQLKSGNSLQNCVTSILLGIWMGFAANLRERNG